MRKIVLTYGLIAGAILSVMMVITLVLIDGVNFDNGEVIGYTTMVVAFLLVYFGIRSYKETLPGQRISFGKALQVGALISLVASSCYVATWEVIYYKISPDFGDKYAAHAIEAKKAKGASPAELAALQKQMEEFKQMYKNPLVNVAYTFLEPLPVALVITLVCAGVHSRRKRAELATA